METIVGVAIKMHSGSVASLPRPARHLDLLIDLQRCGQREGPAPEGAHDSAGRGFLTSEGRFVDRMEAASIAIAAGQVTRVAWPSRGLYSEDVW